MASEGERFKGFLDLAKIKWQGSLSVTNFHFCQEWNMQQQKLITKIAFSHCIFYSLTDNKLFENADTAKSRVVQLEIQVAQLQQVGIPVSWAPLSGPS